MSSLDRIKKKREQLLVENNKSYSSTDKSMERISSLRNELSTTGKIDYGDIAPIKFDNTSTKEEDKKRSWFSAGAFDDGYDFGDVTKTILGTVADVGTNVVKGLTSMGEGIGKLGAGGVAQIADWIGQDEYADKVRNRLAGKDEEYNEFWNKISPTANVNRVSDKLDTSSFIGEKSDDLVSSAGNLLGSAAGQMVGIPWWVTMGTSSAGQELENAYKSGATDGEAWTSAAICGASEILFEKLTGGIKFGGRTLDEGLKRTLSNAITNKTAQTLTKLGFDMVGEGAEEVLTEKTSNIGKKLTYEDEKTWGEALASEEAMDNYLEAFIGGAVMGGVFNSGKVVSSLKTGRDYDTGLTANEQKVVDSEVAKRTEGKNLTKKQIAEIETEVKNELEKGYISTDTIESVLGGDTYNNLKSTRDNKTKIENEIKALEGKKNAEITVKEMEHLKDLREQLKGIDTNTLETDLQGKMGQIIKSDGYLQRSYQEKAKRGQKFTYDASKVTNEFEKAALESASKVMNDTNRSHEFVEPVVKLAKDKGTYYEFTNNAELEKSNYDVKGKQVNGLVTVEKDGKKKILINVDSAKALNSIVGHETTHLLEGTQEYQELQDAIFNYAKTKGDFDSRQASLYSLYKGIKGADVNSELTADLVGDYLFTDNNFISELSTQKPTVFQKIKELIDDLVVRFKGTKEEKALREVQKKFKEAYRQQSGQQTGQESDTQTDTQYSLTDNQGRTLTKEQQEYFKDSKVRDENGRLLEVYHGTKTSGINVFNYSPARQTGDDFGKAYYFTSDYTKAQGYQYNVNEDPRIIQHEIEEKAARQKMIDAGFTEEARNEYKNWLDTHNVADYINDESYVTEGGETKKLYLNLTNPLEVDANGEYYHKVYPEYFKTARENGNDGIIVKNVIDNPRGEHRPIDVYIAFNENQIKNIDNTNPTTDADIRYSLSEKGLKEIADEFGGGKNYWEANLYDKDLYGATYFLKHQDSVKKKFKELNNINIEPVYKDIELKGIGTKDENVQNFIKDNNLNVVDLANNQELLDKFYKLEHEAIKKQFNIDDAEADELFSQWKDYFEKQKGVNETIWPLLRFEKDFRNIIEGNTKEIDNIETAKLERQLVDDSPEFERFVTKYAEKLFGEKVEYDADDVMEEAKFNHGTTDNFEVGAYMTTDGSLLNFNYGGYRDDHRTLSVYDLNMKEFMDYGAIRMQPETPGFEMQVEPTNEQYDKLYDYIDYIKSTRKSDDAISIDIDKGNSYDSATYTMNTPTSKIINDVKTYWKTGQFPKQSEFAQFRYSLSKENEIAPRNPNLTYGEDVKLQVEETIAPLQEEIQTLTETVNELKEQLAPVRDEYAPLTEEDLPYLEQQYNEAPKENIAPPETEENIPVAEDEITPTKSLFETRNYEEVGNRKVNAYQYDNPEVKPYFQEAARSMIDDLAYSLKGQRIYNDQLYYDSNGEQGFFGINRFTSNDIAELLDGVDGKYKLSYKDLEKGLKAIIEDKGAENNAASKRIEFYLDKRLREGFTTLDGVEIPANQEYLDLLETKEMNDYYSNIPIGEAPVENVGNPVGNVSKTKASESNVPIKEMNTNDSGQGVLDLGTLTKLKAPEGEIKNKYAEPIDKNTAKQLTIEGKEEDLVTKTKKELRKALLGTEAQKEFITNALDNAKNRSMALMNNTDTIRNTELVFGRDAGNVINEVIFQKEIDNEADSIAWQNKERQEIKDLGIKARSIESAAVQKYGEKQYINDNNEVVAYGDVELAKEFSDVATQEKIKNAAKVIRSKYDAYIDNANNVLTKLGFEPIKKRNDYMRHFQELNDVFTRYGIPFNAQNMQEHTLPTDINGLTEFWSPQKNYFANMQPRKGMKTTYDAITGIDGYIGGIANLIYHTEDIQRGRAFEELIRETYGEDKGFDNLENLPEELQQARMEKIQDNHLSNYAAWVHEWTNNVAGKKNKIDRSIEAMFGRKAFAVLDEVRKQVGSNMIGLNLSSSLTNLIAPVQAASKTNKLAVLKGTADTIKNMFVKDNFMDNNKFLTARMGTDMLSQNAWQKIQNAGYVFMKGMDWFSSNQIVRSKYYELRAKGMSEAQAHSEAGKFAARIMGDRTKGANAQLYNSKLVGLVTQFQLEVNNQLYSQFYDTYHESKEAAQGDALKTAAGMTFTLGQLFALTHLFGQKFEAIAGYNPTFDVVEMIKTAFGWGDDEEEEEKPLSERLKATADQLVDALPYVNTLTGGGRIPIASGIPNLVGVATGGKDQYGNELTLEDEMKKLLYLIPPTGGNQFKKTTQGLSMFDEELPVTGSYTDSGNLRFPVEDTLGNRVQAAVFGQWASENARNYFDNERQPLKEKQIQEYADLDMPIKDYWKYREGLKEQSTIEEKFEYINGLDVTDEQKNIMINNATGRENPIDMSGYDNFANYDEFDYATKNPDKYRVIEQIDTFDNFNSYKEDIKSIKEQFSEDNGYSTKDRKAAVQQYINSLSLDIPQKIMLEKMAGGYSIKDYENYMFSYIQSLPMTAEEKQAIHKQLFD